MRNLNSLILTEQEETKTRYFAPYCPNLYTVPFPVEDFLLDNGEGIFDGIVYLMILESFFNF